MSNWLTLYSHKLCGSCGRGRRRTGRGIQALCAWHGRRRRSSTLNWSRLITRPQQSASTHTARPNSAVTASTSRRERGRSSYLREKDILKKTWKRSNEKVRCFRGGPSNYILIKVYKVLLTLKNPDVCFFSPFRAGLISITCYWVVVCKYYWSYNSLCDLKVLGQQFDGNGTMNKC